MADKLMDCSNSNEMTASNQASVLLIEEDTEVRSGLQALLHRWGYTVTAAGATAEWKILRAPGAAGITVFPIGDPT